MFEQGDVILCFDNGFVVIVIDNDEHNYFCTRYYHHYLTRMSSVLLPIDAKYYKIGNVREVKQDA